MGSQYSLYIRNLMPSSRSTLCLVLPAAVLGYSPSHISGKLSQSVIMGSSFRQLAVGKPSASPKTSLHVAHVLPSSGTQARSKTVLPTIWSTAEPIEELDVDFDTLELAFRVTTTSDAW